MKKLGKGPQLKMPDLKNLKAPPFLADVYYDLRDRRLLPLIALVVVATAAVPFLLGDSEEVVPPPPVVEAQILDELGVSEPTALNVVESKPGLRDYRKRLRGRSPTDPFEQQYTGIPPQAQLTVTGGDGSGSGGGSSTSITVDQGDNSTTEVEVDPPRSSPPQRPSGAGKPRPQPDADGLTFYAFRPDVRFGVAGSGKLNVRKEIPLTTLLPKKNPVVMFLGVSEDGKRAVFDVSAEVAYVRGDGGCIGGRASCGLLFLRAGEAVDLLTGKPNRNFRLKVVRIEFVPVKRPKPATSSGGEQRAAWAPGLSAGLAR